MGEVDALLERAGIARDADVEFFALAHLGTELVGCMGLAGDVVKSTAVEESLRGTNLVAPLLMEVRYAAIERGHGRLFVYARPKNARVFSALGFRPLAEVPDLAVLMEDDPRGIERYQASLSAMVRQGERIGAVVINANPFTLGHEYLLRAAAADCDIVHVFVVGEDRSLYTYGERFHMVNSGVAQMPERDRIVVHGGSRYVVSGSTFPQYFLKDAPDVSRAYTGIDLQLFRGYIAPVLGIRHRFVGTEPTSEITAQYNAEMTYWLCDAPMAAPPIEVHELQRVGAADQAFVSASKVRALLRAGRLSDVRRLVPATTYDFLVHKQPWDAVGAGGERS